MLHVPAVVVPSEVGQNFSTSWGLTMPRPSFFSLPSKVISRQLSGVKVKPVRLVDTLTSLPSKNFDHVPVSMSSASTSTPLKLTPPTLPPLLVPTNRSLGPPHRLFSRSFVVSQGAKTIWTLTASPVPGPWPLGPSAAPHQLQMPLAALAGPETTP